MLVYDGTKTEFLRSVEQDTIAFEIEQNIYEKMNRHTARNEFRAWENSLEYMYKVLNDQEIPEDAGIAIEYNIPQTSKRVDFLISGYGKDEKGNVVIIELKQWDKVESVKGKDALVETYTGNAIRRVVHPSYQAWSYAMLISDYNQSVQEKNILLWPCAYMHNYRRKENDPIDEEQYKIYQDDAPVFSRGQVDMLRAFIKKSVCKGDNKELLYSVEHGKIRPSKSLQESILKMLKGNREFVMLDDQKHRLNEKSGMFQNMGENQIKEIIHAACCSVFFIDESQRVTLNDIGSVDEIEKWAKQADAEIIYMELISQFRCNGSDGYLAWLDNTLEIRETANWNMDDIDYDIQIMDSPHDVRKVILEKNKISNNRARILAGYCWNWLKEGQNDTEVHDIKIGDFEMSWNLKNTTTFAIDENSVNEIGCIHTSQGLEFDYVGVIIGDDMRYEDGKVLTDHTRRAKTDQSLKGIKKLYKEDPEKAQKVADEIIKNTYRTLMTRGMKGCYVYCVDEHLADYLRRSLK